ncbi:2-amino-4-hydroxy-6-hydroxymethyldihydropteridine diphosphokinase [Chlamydia ibidis]|uniref:2-amino-4-hydroxy-6-hydroxymethyldihydropteridine diphosphokinase n=2 Tax=Chlamydia ibidis TaxID=1405396 RepID=S7J2C8_9CHLA|nr:dihydropteroate synthase [Chlamydia ibidis]EPP34579.1 2-amino-4-hydroxy-6-hydroxymethyldihydropteridine diphosphokinase [Chlamydia ibidis]EQM63154.1 2-amino-4-hydroxy-6-hydroxymethyldihydropteridine pyrophosphokinase [Chlamydia ibidis 10-1398/6]
MSSLKFVCLSVGSNLGNRLMYFQKAYKLLKDIGLQDLRSSIVLETKALLPTDAPSEWDLPFLNSVIIGKTSLSCEDLLSKIKNIEITLGREISSTQWAPRVLDIDILLYGNDEAPFTHETCITPHPELLRRPFFISLIASLCPQKRLYQPGSQYHLKTFLELAHLLPCTPDMILRSLAPSTLLMGIVNITNNSISDGGLYLEPTAAVAHAEKLYVEGAAIVDLGAQATNPKVKALLSAEEEWQRLEPVLNILSERWSGFLQYPDISIDTFYPEIIERAAKIYPIRWINDVSGGSREMAQLAKNLGISLIINHSCSLPPRADITLGFTTTAVDQLLIWGEEQISTFTSLGLPKEQIVFDPGIGFGTTAIQSMEILLNMEKFQTLGCRTLVGHSRKSCLSLLGQFDATNRDWETATLSACLQRQNVNYLRVHNVEANQRALTTAAWSGVSL